jgi:hypothetical protein
MSVSRRSGRGFGLEPVRGSYMVQRPNQRKAEWLSQQNRDVAHQTPESGDDDLEKEKSIPTSDLLCPALHMSFAVPGGRHSIIGAFEGQQKRHLYRLANP